MDKDDKNMDNICAWLNRLADWCDRSAMPPIPYAGFSRVGFRNPPAEHLELVYMVQGQIDDLQIGDRCVCLPQGSLSLHNVHRGNFSKRLQTNLASWCLFLDVAGVEEFECLNREVLFCRMSITHSQRVAGLFENISTLCHLSDGKVFYMDPIPAYDPKKSCLSHRLRIKGATLELLAALIEEASSNADEKLDAPTASVVEAARTFMGRTYMKPTLCLADVADSVGFHPDHLGRLFRKQLGLTPMQYLKRLRMNRAVLLLQHSALPIGEIAQEVGFADPLHFSRVFRSQTGQCARDYRQGRRLGRI